MYTVYVDSPIHPQHSCVEVNEAAPLLCHHGVFEQWNLSLIHGIHYRSAVNLAGLNLLPTVYCSHILHISDTFNNCNGELQERKGK